MIISPQEALNIILNNTKQLRAKKVKLSEAYSQAGASDTVANIDVPAFDNSAMDGFAIKDIDGEELEIIAEIQAGQQTKITLRNSDAISIMTGAPVPKGCLAVVPIENTKVHGKTVKVIKHVAKGENIRRAGEDIRRGQTIIKKSTVLSPVDIALAASVGLKSLDVIETPKVAIVVTGDEIIAPGKKLAPGQIYESNSFLLEGLLKSNGIVDIKILKVKDEIEDTVKMLSKAISAADIVLTTGGISVGKYDLVALALKKLGAKRLIESVSQKPGKPLSYFKLKETSVISLPGNPVAVGVCFELYVRPVLLKMAGHKEIMRKELKARLAHAIKKKKGRTNYARVSTIESEPHRVVEVTGKQGSGILTSLRSDGIAVLPKDAEHIEKGQEIKVISFEGDYK